ncbi:MAG: hypothetical protein E7Y34_02750, partial [Mycoplasma sp.]|nr:hypothetical protein [Mycoplasma sp.]
MKEYKYKLFDLLKKYEIKPKKHLGQNFLIDNSCFLSILKDIDLKNQIVIEIGSGLGGLTSVLIKKSKKVIAIEYDNFLFEVLKKEFKDFNNLELTNTNFLNYEFNSDSKAIVFGNIPYNITSLILFKLFKNINNIELCYLLLQKEIAEKLVAKAKSSFYNKL